MRLTAQLIDSTDGSHRWADRFDGGLDDVFDLQDRITQDIVTAIEVQLTGAEQARDRVRPDRQVAAATARPRTDRPRAGPRSSVRGRQGGMRSLGALGLVDSAMFTFVSVVSTRQSKRIRHRVEAALELNQDHE